MNGNAATVSFTAQICYASYSTNLDYFPNRFLVEVVVEISKPLYESILRLTATKYGYDQSDILGFQIIESLTGQKGKTRILKLKLEKSLYNDALKVASMKFRKSKDPFRDVFIEAVKAHLKTSPKEDYG